MDVSKPIVSNYGYFKEKYGEHWNALAESLRNEFADSIDSILMPENDKVDMPTFIVKKADFFRVLTALKDRHQYSFLSDYTATDEEEEPRFFIVLHLMHLDSKSRIRVKTKVSEVETMPTLIPLWEGANWAEREIFDMFGIRFDGHPDLRRILMDQRWEGHPLRKDYPLRGYQIFLTPEPLDPELLK